MGVPALFAAAGFTGASERSREFVKDRYHQPTDAWDATWSMEGAAEYVAGRGSTAPTSGEGSNGAPRGGAPSGPWIISAKC